MTEDKSLPEIYHDILKAIDTINPAASPPTIDEIKEMIQVMKLLMGKVDDWAEAQEENK